MLKLLLAFLIIGFSQSINALNIENVSISSINQGINIHLKTRDAYLFYYNAFEYNIVNNVITLRVCYTPGFESTQTFLENDFQIQLDNTNISEYSLIVNIYYINTVSFSCDYQNIRDFESLPFISLSSFTFENNKLDFTVFPNPTTGVLNFKQDSTSINKINLLDHLGRLIKTFSGTCISRIDLRDLENGIYFIVLNTEKEKITRKIILKK